MRLLLLSAGSLAAHSILDALGARRQRCVVIGTNSIAEAAGNFRCDIAHVAPPSATGAEYGRHIVRLIASERPHLVIPTRDDDVVALALLREEPAVSGAVLLTGSLATARMTRDKLDTARFALRHGLPFAETTANAGEAAQLARKHGFPLIGKPRCGGGARGVVLLRTAAEIAKAFASRADLIAQPFIDKPQDDGTLSASHGPGFPFFYSFPETRQYTAQIVVGPQGELSEPFGCLATLLSGQTVEYRRCDDADLLAVTRRYARAAAVEGWRGPLNVQLKRASTGELIAHELNGRMGGGAGSRALMGFDEVGEVVARFLPDADFPGRSEPAADVVQQYLRTYPVPRGALEMLAATGRWSRADAAR